MDVDPSDPHRHSTPWPDAMVRRLRHNGPMAPKATEEAVAQAAPLAAARAAAGGGSGSADPLVAELRRAGLLPLLVLHLLRDEPSYGNALIERVGGATNGLVAVNPNTMYPLLRRLEADGFVAGEWEHPERRSRRAWTPSPRASPRSARSSNSRFDHEGLTSYARGMTSRVSEKGQVTIPKQLRSRFGIRPGEEVTFREEDGRIVLEKVAVASRFEKFYGILSLEQSTDEYINETRGTVELP